MKYQILPKEEIQTWNNCEDVRGNEFVLYEDGTLYAVEDGTYRFVLDEQLFPYESERLPIREE